MNISLDVVSIEGPEQSPEGRQIGQEPKKSVCHPIPPSESDQKGTSETNEEESQKGQRKSQDVVIRFLHLNDTHLNRPLLCPLPVFWKSDLSSELLLTPPWKLPFDSSQLNKLVPWCA